MRRAIVKTGTTEDFFKRGSKVAKLADQGARLAEERIISFEDPGDVLRLLTTARLALFRTIKERPGSITDVAERLHRERSAVKRDVDELEKVGLVRVNPKVLPGHGLMKEVSVAARQFRLEAQLA